MIGNKIIKASAGTGKTYALTGHMLKLLARDVRPERIVALTFTRAAAGEIFDKLVTRLASAAANPAAARHECLAEPELGTLHQSDFIRMLRQVIARMHLSPIGTLDSLFVRIVRTFPFEFGISGDFTLLDEHALGIERNAIFRRLLAGSPAGKARAAQQAFLHAFRQATFGKDEKRLQDLLSDFVDTYHPLYLTAPEADIWANPQRIWPRGCTWHAVPAKALHAAAAAAAVELEAMQLTDAQHAKWRAFLDLAADFTPSAVLSRPGAEIFDKLLVVYADMSRGSAEITVYRRLCLGPDLCAHLLVLTQHVAACLIRARLQSTAGLHGILQSYENEYDRNVRARGRLTFADVNYLLSRSELRSEPLADAAATNSSRLFIEYRLDSQFEHWALDEFQDTSRPQWEAIRNLIDEVIQDSSGQRTFFAVGDVKQAIYGWRGGDASLLTEIERHYRLDSTTLAASWRSCPEVIRTVNAVFDNLAGMEALPAVVRQRWKSVWEHHRTALPPEIRGYGTVMEVRATAETTKPGRGDWQRTVITLLQRIEPWRRSLSTAVLVRANAPGIELAAALRDAGLPAIWEGDKGIADNPVTAALLSLFRYAQHPGDTLAWEHLCMTPLRACLTHDCTLEQARENLPLEVLRDVGNHGFAFTVENWQTRLEEQIRLDAFSRRRLQELLAAAQSFDATGSKDSLDFAAFVESYTVSDLAAAGTIRVMTMHRSKGLDFDVVVLPLQPGRQGLDSIGSARVLTRLQQDADGRDSWILLAPPKAVCEADPELRERLVAGAMRNCYEELCLLYVAMTRAKRGLYILVPPAPRSRSAALHVAGVVRHTVSAAADAASSPKCDDPESGDEPTRVELFANGSEDWFANVAAVATCPETAAMPPTARRAASPENARRQRFTRRVPSRLGAAPFPAPRFFSQAMPQSREFGTALHALFQELEWLDSGAADAAVERWHRRFPRLPDAAAVEQTFRRALQTAEVRAALRRPPAGEALLWREKSFELILDGEWISGTFDRVVLQRLHDGPWQTAQILDFKSSRLDSEADEGDAAQRYAPQLRLYRQAVAALTGITPAAVNSALLFTDSARVLPCAD